MQSFYLLVPLALIIIALAIKLLFWAINNGQYDDLDTEGHRILFDDDNDKSKAKGTPRDLAEDKENVKHDD
jgi:cbb3-type cytochrome oxidase maturation protein